MKRTSAKILPNLEISDYIFSTDHAGLHNPRLPLAMPSLNSDGSNLTLTFLSYNRVNLTLRLLQSWVKAVPDFAGKILILDNHSSLDQLASLKDFLKNFPFPVTIIEKERNYGVGGGRNLAAKVIETDWLLSLDNDMIVTSNPLPALRAAVDTLGVHYVNLPILQENGYQIFSCGGNLWVDSYQGGYVIGNSSVYQQVTKFEVDLTDPFLCTFLLGGASMIHRPSFLGQGGYDDLMLVGFEDLEFSLRLYQQGIKIATAAVFSLIHAHERAVQAEDIEYEQVRYSQEALRASADHFLKKHGLVVWTPWVEEWLKQKRIEVGLDSGGRRSNTNHGAVQLPARRRELSVPGEKKRIALIADVRDWVFNNLSNQIISRQSGTFEFDVFYSSEYENVVLLLNLLSDYDLIHFFYRETLMTLFVPDVPAYFEEHGGSYVNYVRDYVTGLRLTTSVFDHLFLSDSEIALNEVLFNALTCGYTVSSQKLWEIYQGIDTYKPPQMTVEDGVDLDFFHPQNLDRLVESGREIIVGWTGNSQWGMWIDQRDHKGFLTIIQVAVDELRKEGIPVRGHYIDRNVNGLPFTEMPAYYNSLDIYLCASDIEGTPNTVLEAMACGLPVISTNVGIVPEVFGEQQKQFIADRSVASFKEKILQIVENPELRQVLSQENLARIQNWSWQAKTDKWRSFFATTLEYTSSDAYKQETMARRMILARQAQIAQVDYQNRKILKVTSTISYRSYVRVRESALGIAFSRAAQWAAPIVKRVLRRSPS